MRVLKRILIGLGSLSLVLLALFAWLNFESGRFTRDEAPFVKAYVMDLSRHWNVADVYARSDNEFIAQADSALGQRTIQRFRSLGSLTSIADFELKNYSDSTWGRRGVFDFKAAFENGEALVEVTVVKRGDAGTRVLAINLSSVQISRTAARSRVST
jgi:hypothetical protein